MKETLTLSGKVQVSRQEITQALNEWLLRNKKLKVSRAIYVTKDNTVDSAVLEVRQELAVDRTIPEFSLPKEEKKRNMPKGWSRRNTGVFNTIREYIKEYKEKKLKSITLDELLSDVQAFQPYMTRNRLSIYIRDKRQLPGIKYDSQAKEVTF